MAEKMCFKVLCISMSLFVVGAECKRIDDIERKLNIFEKKLDIQTYENMEMKKGIQELERTLSAVLENITDLVREDTDCVLDNGNVDFMKTKQELGNVVKLTKSMLQAFKAEKQMRIKTDAELETVRNNENALKENLEAIKKNLQVQKDTFTQQYEKMQHTIAEIQANIKDKETDIKMEALKETISHLETKYDTRVNSMDTKYSSVVTKIAEVAESLNMQNISFSARLSSSIENLAPWQTVTFKHVITNTGNAYSGATGVFSAPIPGVYVFYTHILAVDRSLEMCIQLNGSCVSYLYVHGSTHGGDSNMIVLHLKKGDEVKVVRHGHYGLPPFYVHHTWSSFSGFILHPL